MIDFLLLMIVPVLLALGYLWWEHYSDRIDGMAIVRDGAMQIGAAALAVIIGLCAAYYGHVHDTEIWNGQITSKESVHVGCRHAHTTCISTGKSQTCITTYEHVYDVDWNVYSSTGEKTTIDTIDRQGLRMPPRWGSAYIGEPFSSSHSYQNYILANPASVLLGTKGDLQKFGKLIPSYPEVYDYYRADHFINAGVPGVDSNTWNYLVNMANRTLGTAKQANVIVIAVPTSDPSYFYALRDAWVGGKKNDAIILIGSENGHDIDWASVMSWTPNKEYNIYLRDRIMDIKYLDHRDDIIKAINEETMIRFQRMHMKDYKWLMYSFHPSGSAMLWVLFFAVLSCGGACFASHQLHEENW